MSDLSELSVEEMLYLKDELNAAYAELLRRQQEWIELCRGLDQEMRSRSLDLKNMEEEAKKHRVGDYDHMYEANNNLH
tara:strand:+ start:365 stop:598 length:234 start_codon:yes stop_codon:yes gene_type:complete